MYARNSSEELMMKGHLKSHSSSASSILVDKWEAQTTCRHNLENNHEYVTYLEVFNWSQNEKENQISGQFGMHDKGIPA